MVMLAPWVTRSALPSQTLSVMTIWSGSPTPWMVTLLRGDDGAVEILAGVDGDVSPSWAAATAAEGAG